MIHVKENPLPEDLVIMANLVLSKETIWSGFLWYLATAPAEGFACISFLSHTSQTHARLPVVVFSFWLENPTDG